MILGSLSPQISPPFPRLFSPPDRNLDPLLLPLLVREHKNPKKLAEFESLESHDNDDYFLAEIHLLCHIHMIC